MAKGKHKILVKSPKGPLMISVIPTAAGLPVQNGSTNAKITKFFTAAPTPKEPKLMLKSEAGNPLLQCAKVVQSRAIKSEVANGGINKSIKTSILKSSPSIANGSVQNSKLCITRTSPNTAISTPPKTASRFKTKSSQSTVRRIKISPVNNRQLTEYFPIRRSCRQTRALLMKERQRRVAEILLSGKEDGLRVEQILGKGRGVVAAKSFKKGEFVVEYSGELIDLGEAKHRETLYAQDQNTGCYMYYFIHNNRRYCMDATAESDRLGRLVNHSRTGNLVTKSFTLDGVPRLILVAKQDIKCGDELLYDYGDRSKESLESHPWLAM